MPHQRIGRGQYGRCLVRAMQFSVVGLRYPGSAGVPPASEAGETPALPGKRRATRRREELLWSGVP